MRAEIKPHSIPSEHLDLEVHDGKAHIFAKLKPEARTREIIVDLLSTIITVWREDHFSSRQKLLLAKTHLQAALNILCGSINVLSKEVEQEEAFQPDSDSGKLLGPP